MSLFWACLLLRITLHQVVINKCSSEAPESYYRFCVVFGVVVDVVDVVIVIIVVIVVIVVVVNVVVVALLDVTDHIIISCGP